jgi:hypothetical protein
MAFNVTAQEGRNASQAMDDVLPGTITMCRFVSRQAPVSTRVNPESVSKEINESDMQFEKHAEQRI